MGTIVTKAVVPEDVLTALKALVEWARDEEEISVEALLVNLPVIAEWLEELGVMTPAPK